MNARPCLFCGLTRGEGEVSVVHEDERVVVFMDIQPVVRGHLLVVPRVHALLSLSSIRRTARSCFASLGAQRRLSSTRRCGAKA